MRQSLKTKRNYQIIFGVVCLLLTASFIFFQGANLIAKPYIESHLKQFADNLSTQAAQSGDIANFTYDSIEISNDWFKKKAIIKNPKLEYTARLPFGNVQRTDISTSQAIVSAVQLSFNAIQVHFPDPFTLERNGYSALKVSFNGQPHYSFAHGNTQDTHAIFLPDSVVLSPTNVSDKPVEITISYKNPQINRTITHKNASNKTIVSFEDVTLTSNLENKKMHVDKLAGTSEESSTEQSKRIFATTFDVNNLVITSPDIQHGPYYFSADIGGTYLLPNFAESPQAAVSDMDITLNKFMLKTNEYSVEAKGALSQKPDDQMYFGNADIAISGFDKFRNSEFVPVIDASLKDNIIAAITGNADPEAKEASINLKREKLGTFYIGQTTFENLIGMIVTHSLTQSQDKANPQVAPMSPAPGQAPQPDIESLPEPQNPIVTPNP